MKKEIFVPVTIAVLSIGFLIVSALVYFSRGNPKLIKSKLKLGALILTLNGAVFTAGAQTVVCYVEPSPPPRNFIGMIIDYNHSHFEGIKLRDNKYMSNLKTMNLKGSGYYGGIIYEYKFGADTNMFNPSLIGKLVYNDYSCEGKKYIPELEITDLNGESYTVSANLIKKFSTGNLNLDLLCKLNLFETSFGIATGFSFALNLNSGTSETLIIENDNSESDITQTISYDPDLRDFTAYWIISLEYEILMGYSYIVPEIGYSINLTSIQFESDMKMTSIFAGFSFRFGF